MAINIDERGPQPTAKFSNPDWTAKGEARAIVPFEGLRTLWVNTGTLCNITCRNCYIDSSPSNDSLVYLTQAEVLPFLAEAQAQQTRDIGFTGGEPFLNPEFIDILEAALARGFNALVLTNAMLPMQRPAVKAALARLAQTYGQRLVVRVSLDHYTQALHEVERGPDTWAKTLAGVDWLVEQGIATAIAGRTCWNEAETAARAGYAALFAARSWPVDAADAASLVLFPEMVGEYDGPEITTACWGILKKHPGQMMCATSRMVVKRKGAAAPVVLPCTLIAYDAAFEMGETLAQARQADGGMFVRGGVKLCHKHCAKFCVLGGGACS